MGGSSALRLTCGTGECTSKQLWTFTLSLTWFSTLILTRASSRGRLLPSLTVDPHIFRVAEMGVKGLRSRVRWHHLGWSSTLWVCDKTAACQWPWSRKPRGSFAHQEPLYGKTRWTGKLACNPVPVKFTRYRTIPQVWDLILIHYQFIPLMNTGVSRYLEHWRSWHLLHSWLPEDECGCFFLLTPQTVLPRFPLAYKKCQYLSEALFWHGICNISGLIYPLKRLFVFQTSFT